MLLLVLSITLIAIIMELMYELFRFALGALFFIGLLLFLDGHSFTGLLSIGIVGYIIILIILTGFLSFLIIFIPGIVAGIFTIYPKFDTLIYCLM